MARFRIRPFVEAWVGGRGAMTEDLGKKRYLIVALAVRNSAKRNTPSGNAPGGVIKLNGKYWDQILCWDPRSCP